MREGWKKYKLGDVARLLKKQYSPNKKDGLAYIGLEHIEQQTLRLNGIGKSSKVTSQKFRFSSGDILFGKLRPYFRKVYRPKFDGVCSTDIWVVRAKEGFEQSFLFYFMANQDFINESNSGSSGTRMPRADWDHLSKTEWNIPESIETQRRIASILSALDDKIELNRQTNQTLEAIAQAIFKEWFVDFRFPHSPLEGWQAKPDGVDSSLRPCPTGGVDSLHAKPASLPSWQKNSLFPFWTLPKNHTLQERAKELRKQGILSEVVFWKAFKDKKKLGWDIDRQVIIGNFIVDFFIPELGLVFEIDGSSHNDKQEYDQERDAFLSSLQLKVVRISDKDVLRNIEGVWSFVKKSIKDRVEELEEKSPPRPSGTPQEGNNPPRQASPATPQEGNKCEMQDSELGPIPKGWRVGKLGEIYKTTSGGTPSRSKPEFYENGTIYWVKSKELNGSFITETEEKITQEALQKSSAKLLPAYSVLIAMYGATVGEFGIISMEATCNQAICAFLSCDEFPYTFIYHFLKNSKDEIISRAVGSAQQNISQDLLKQIDVILPPKELLKKFHKAVNPLFQVIENNIKQSDTLAAIRDALLPKLMNGEVGVALEEIV
ncbi:MAG: restriction endonuclease subunit S [Candidatus Brocadiaceae bacterium]